MKGKSILLLAFAIASETIGTTCLKLSDGFSHPLFSVVTAVCYIVSLSMLTSALKHLSLGMAYGIWGGVGTMLTTIVGIALWHDPFTLVMGVGMVAIIAGVALLSAGTQEAEEAVLVK